MSDIMQQTIDSMDKVTRTEYLGQDTRTGIYRFKNTENGKILDLPGAPLRSHCKMVPGQIYYLFKRENGTISCRCYAKGG